MDNTLEYKGYHATIEYSAEDCLLVGTVIGVQDSLYFHGSNVEELKQSMESCIENYLVFCREVGKDPDKEYKGSFNVRVSPELHRDADIAAKSAGISLNQFVQNAISLALHGEKTESFDVRADMNLQGLADFGLGRYKQPVPIITAGVS